MRNKILSGVVLAFIFGLTLGMTVGMHDTAAAKPPPCAQCYYDGIEHCTTELAPKCPPTLPYGLYEKGSCSPGGAYNWSCRILHGCCNANCFCIHLAIPEPLEN